MTSFKVQCNPAQGTGGWSAGVSGSASSLRASSKGQSSGITGSADPLAFVPSCLHWVRMGFYNKVSVVGFIKKDQNEWPEQFRQLFALDSPGAQVCFCEGGAPLFSFNPIPNGWWVVTNGVKSKMFGPGIHGLALNVWAAIKGADNSDCLINWSNSWDTKPYPLFDNFSHL